MRRTTFAAKNMDVLLVVVIVVVIVAYVLKRNAFNELQEKYLEVLNDKVELQKKKMMQQGFTSWRSTVQKEKHAELHKTIKALREEINKLEAADEKACDEIIRIVNCSFKQQDKVNELQAEVKELKEKGDAWLAQLNDVSSKWQLSQLDTAEVTCENKRLQEELARGEKNTHALLHQMTL